MLDLCPRRFVKRLPRRLQSQGAKALTSLAIAGAGIASNAGLLARLSIWSGFSGAIGRLRSITHGGIRCPLCGGTRSFLALLKGDIASAFGYSIFGTIVFFLVFGTLPFRIWAIVADSQRWVLLLEAVDTKLENWFLQLLFAAYLLQILLDKVGLVTWNA